MSFFCPSVSAPVRIRFGGVGLSLPLRIGSRYFALDSMKGRHRWLSQRSLSPDRPFGGKSLPSGWEIESSAGRREPESTDYPDGRRFKRATHCERGLLVNSGRPSPELTRFIFQILRNLWIDGFRRHHAPFEKEMARRPQSLWQKARLILRCRTPRGSHSSPCGGCRRVPRPAASGW